MAGKTTAGVLYGGDGHQLGVQVLGIIAIGLWSCTLSFIMFQMLRIMCILRVPQDEEVTGLDVSHHPEGPKFEAEGKATVVSLHSMSTTGTRTTT